jgi:flagellar FliL protein
MLWRKSLVWVCVLFFAGAIAAQDDKAADEKGEGEEAGKPAARAIYVPVKPAFVVNYGGKGKLKYMKLEVSLRVEDTYASNAIRHHMPLIRDYLVTEFSRLKDEDVDTQEGKERVRLSALKGIENLLMEEDGSEGVMDLFFNNFVIQR